MGKRKTVIGLTIILFTGVILFALNLMVGSISIPLRTFFDILFGHESGGYGSVSGVQAIDSETARTIILNYRLPQALTAIFAGIGLSVSGLLMQTLFRNPLADPSILGISSGASLGVALTVLLTGSIGGLALSSIPGWSIFGITAGAFIGALLVLFLILTLSLRLRNMLSLILVGIMVSYIAGSMTDILKYFSNKDEVHAFVIWGLGSFTNLGTAQGIVMAVCVVAGAIAAALSSKSLNLLLLGDRYAENLGLNLRRSKLIILLTSGFLTAIVTAFCGPIAFLGLAVPHLARFLFHTSDHFLLIPASALMGMDIALLCNLIARLPGFDGNLPINSVTALIGAPIVIYVIFNRQKSNA